MDSPNQPTVSPLEPGIIASPAESSVQTQAPDAPVEAPVQGANLQSGAPGPGPSSAELTQPALPQRRRIVSGFGEDLISSIQSLAGTVVIAIFVITFVVQAFQIPSESMENTLLVGDYLLVNKLCYGGAGLGDHLMPYQKIARRDIIVFHYPVDPRQHFVKRVIGLPGDRLKLVNKKVFINGKPLDEPYVRFIEPPNNLFRDDFPRTDIPAYGLEGKWWLEMKKLVEDGQLIIPEGNYFVMGDNRDDSQDSRYWGFVPQENIIGRPLVIYWSVKDWDHSTEPTFSGRLQHLAYAVTHMFQITRWNRTLRLVH
ncbi:MAG TPA: signal peptidase I [Candidatus Sulfotelmatobacter sp.]|nr:signal peptidase I [Candidatus Sulfotelmatobacter sp.]